VGQNLLHKQHPEFGVPSPTRVELGRSVFVKSTLAFLAGEAVAAVALASRPLKIESKVVSVRTAVDGAPLVRTRRCVSLPPPNWGNMRFQIQTRTAG